MKIKSLDDKYLVLKKEDLERFFSGYTKGVFTTDEEQKIIDNIPFKTVLEGIWNDRVANGKAGGNKYLVLNMEDEIDLKNLSWYLAQHIPPIKDYKAEAKPHLIKHVAVDIINVILKTKEDAHEGDIP